MTAAGAYEAGPGHWAGRPWRALRRLSSRTSLRTKLIATLLALVIVASLAISMAGISLLRGEVIGPIDRNLLSYTYGHNAYGVASCAEQYVSSGDTGICETTEDMFWIGSNNQAVSIPTYGSINNMQVGSTPPPGPSLTGLVAWLQGNPRQAITVASPSGTEQWRVMSFPAPDGSGMVVVAQDATSAYNTLRQVTEVDVIVSVVIIVVLALVGFAVVQSNLRPLVEIEETAEAIADGHLNRRVPERDPRTEIGSLGRSLNIMLSQIEAAFHAREESEAAAHQSEERMRRFIADASHELRTPLTAIRGFAEYYRQRGGMVSHWDRAEAGDAGSAGAQALGGGMNPDDLDRIMQRVEKEAARMGVLVEDLLLLARLDQQRPLARQPVDLLSLAADAVHDARLLSPSRTIELSVQPGAAFLIEGDEVRLRQVIGNLMSNALTHTPDGTRDRGDDRLRDPRPAGERLAPGGDRRRDRPRPGHDLRASAPCVRAVLPRGPGPHARYRRQRAGPGHRERAGLGPRRCGLRADRAGTRRDVPDRAAARRGGAGRPAGGGRGRAVRRHGKPDITAGADDASVTYGTEVDALGRRGRGGPAGRPGGGGKRGRRQREAVSPLLRRGR